MNDNVQFARGLVIVVLALCLGIGAVFGVGMLMSKIKGASDDQIVFEDNDAIRDEKTEKEDAAEETSKNNKNKGGYADFDDSLWANAVSYEVGKGKTYPTINEALQRWAADGYPAAIVNIANGEYNEVIRPYSGKTIAFVGESRDGVILKTTSGRYEDTPIIVANSNVQVRNMTVIADHSKNSSFSYDGANYPASRACAIHVDGGDNAYRKGVVYIENVTAISYQSAGIVVGLIPDSTVRIENCEVFSYTEAKFKGKVPETLKYGAILCTNSDPLLYSQRSEEKLELIRVEATAQNTADVLYLGNSSKGEPFKLFAYKTDLFSPLGEDKEGNVIYSQNEGGELVLDELSRKNNNGMINFK